MLAFIPGPELLEPCPCEGCSFALRCKVDRPGLRGLQPVHGWQESGAVGNLPRVPTRERYAALLGAI